METEVLKTIRTEVKAYRIELPCEKEGCDGALVSCSGMTLTSNPPQYPHKCTKCGKEKHILGITYPYIEHEVIAGINFD